MRLWVLSDLHMEAAPSPDAYRPVCPVFDVLVVAGDVWEGDVRRAVDIVARLAAGRPAVFVLGNAELSGGVLDERRAQARSAAQQRNVMLLDDGEAELCGVGFVGGTLWTDGRLGRADALFAGIPPDVEQATLHRRTRGLIEAAAVRPRSGKLVVVTHHAPHPLCVPEAERDQPDSGSFASDLSALTDSGRVAHWIHGHVHGTFELTCPGGTRIVCNAAGQGFSNPAFRDDWVVEV